MAGSLLGVRTFRIEEEQSLMFQPRDHKHMWIINLWLFYMANPPAPQTAITFQFKASLGSTDLPSEDTGCWSWHFVAHLSGTAPFLLLDLRGQWSLAKLSSAKPQVPDTSQGWEGVLGVPDCFPGSTEFHRRKLPCGNSAAALTQPEVAAGPQKAQRGLSFTGGAAATCAVAVTPPGTLPDLLGGWHSLGAPWAQPLPCSYPRSEHTRTAGTQPRLPAAPRASVHLTTQHNTGALTSNSFSSNVFSRCCGITSLNPFWSARNWASIPRKNRQFT